MSASSRRGDLNSDGQVNLNDFSLLASTWHKSSMVSSSSISQTGDNDFQTLLALAENWLQ
jgi:hypothetical protein